MAMLIKMAMVLKAATMGILPGFLRLDFNLIYEHHRHMLVVKFCTEHKKDLTCSDQSLSLQDMIIITA